MVNYAIRAEGLAVRRGRSEVLHGIGLEVPQAAVVGLLGPSGSGKTTLMRAIVGAQRIDRGTLQVLGCAAGDRRLRGRIGYMAQNAGTYDDLTVRQNVRHFATVCGVGRAAADAAIDAVDLASDRDRLVAELSGGERNRVSLAIAMLGRPPLLVLDEPTVGLDPVLRRDLWELFARLAADGTTLLVSSHVMDEARRCDRLVLLRDGRVIAHDTPAGLLERTGTTEHEDAFLAVVEEAA